LSAIPPEAVSAAAEAIGSAMITRQSPEAIAHAALEAAAPLILAEAATRLKAEVADEAIAICAETVLEAVAAERAECIRLAAEHKATWLQPCDEDDHERGLHTHHRRPFADLLGNDERK
jgi:hypothetical protein